MSCKFIVKQMNKDKDNPNNYELQCKESIQKRNLALLLPEDSETGYSFNIMECCANLFYQMAQSLSNNVMTFGSNVTESGLTQNMTWVVKQLGIFLQYFVNSGSWRNKKIETYDSHELATRLRAIADLIENRQD